MQYLRDTLRSLRVTPAATAKDGAAVVLDSAGNEERLFADDASDANSSMLAVSAVQQWAETDDLAEGEGYADRLLALMIGLIEPEIDGELSEEEASDLMDLSDEAASYLEALGVDDGDINSLLNDWDNEVGERVQELVATKLEDGADAAEFVYGDGSDEAALDAVYKKAMVIRKGKKVRINKRVSGKVRLSAAQKIAVAKMHRKSFSGMAKLRRKKSMRARAKMGL